MDTDSMKKVQISADRIEGGTRTGKEDPRERKGQMQRS